MLVTLSWLGLAWLGLACLVSLIFLAFDGYLDAIF